MRESDTLHGHLGISIVKKVDRQRQTDVDWQIRGLTAKVKRELEKKQALRDARRAEVLARQNQVNLGNFGQKVDSSELFQKKTGVRFNLGPTKEENMKLKLQRPSPEKSRNSSTPNTPKKSTTTMVKFSRGKTPLPTTREKNAPILRSIPSLTPEERVEALAKQSRKCAQLTRTSSRSKLSFFNQADSNDTGLDRYRIQGRILGEGAFAIVRTAVQVTTGRWVAIKTYNKLKIVKADKLKSIEQECKLMQAVDSPYVVKFIEKIENTRNIHVVMEYAGKYNLSNYLDNTKEGKSLKPQEINTMLRHIAFGISSMHSAGISHRDMKLHNIVLNSADSIKIVDFGFARLSSTESLGKCGTLQFMSPELFGNCKIDKNPVKNDMWALGVIFYYVMTRKLPFTGQTEYEIRKAVKESDPDYESIEDPDMREIIENLLDKQPELRNTAAEVVKRLESINNKLTAESLA